MNNFDVAKTLRFCRYMIFSFCISYLFIGKLNSCLYAAAVPAFAFLLNVIEDRTRSSWYVVFTAVLFGVMNVVGRQFDVSFSIDGLFSSRTALMRTLVLMIANGTIAYMFLRIIDTYMEETERLHLTRESETSVRKLALMYFLIFAIGWAPYLIVNFPGHAMGDTDVQLAMFANVDNVKAHSVQLLDPNVFFTQHHTVLHTVLLGALTTFGRDVLGSANVGYFLYTLVQYLTITASFGYAIAWLTRFRAGRKLRTILVLFYFFTPFFVEYAIVTTKDIISGALLLMFLLKTIELLYLKTGKMGRGWTVCYFLICLLNMGFRRNGFLILMFSFLFILIAAKGYRKQILILMLCVLVSHVGFGKVWIALKITPPSERVMYSVMYQQTARYVATYPDEVTEEEKEAISGVLNYDKLAAKFNNKTVDRVLWLNNPDATKEDRSRYMKTWLSMFKKHPMCYVQATLQIQNGTYSFGDVTPWNYHSAYAQSSLEDCESAGFELSLLDRFKAPRVFFSQLLQKGKDLPLVNIVMNSAFYNWILVFLLLYAIAKLDLRLWAICMPSAAILGMMILGPTNQRVYFRYEYPMAIMLPIIISVLLLVRAQARSAQGKSVSGGSGQRSLRRMMRRESKA